MASFFRSESSSSGADRIVAAVFEVRVYGHTLDPALHLGETINGNTFPTNTHHATRCHRSRAADCLGCDGADVARRRRRRSLTVSVNDKAPHDHEGLPSRLGLDACSSLAQSRGRREPLSPSVGRARHARRRLGGRSCVRPRFRTFLARGWPRPCGRQFVTPRLFAATLSSSMWKSRPVFLKSRLAPHGWDEFACGFNEFRLLSSCSFGAPPRTGGFCAMDRF